uniref:RING-type domain-containing protein n=1 Tax=Coturnix japonica TaxID=93934 RepID=A0A8C2SVP9_COTJA
MQLPSGAGWGSSDSAGHGPSAPQPCWPVCACRDCSTYHGPFPLTSSSPAPHPAWQTRCRPSATVLRGTWHSPLLLFALSSPVCMLCRRADVHEDICGPLLGDSGLRVHKFCLVSSLGAPSIFQPGMHRVGLRGPEPGSNECCCCSFQHCFVCGEKGASICCAETDCEHSFHLPCATDGECVTHFFGNHRSFCCDHRPQQIVEAAPEPDTCCVICLEPVGDQNSYHTMVCRVCLQAWFHRSCIQGYAISAGILRFRCPVCRDRVRFRTEMHILGIQIPARPWELLLCTSCAVQGTHRKCASLSDSTISWECDSCAGVDSGKRQKGSSPACKEGCNEVSPEPSLLQAKYAHPTQLHQGGASVLHSSLWLSSGPSPTAPQPSCIVCPRPRHSTPVRIS